MLASERPAEFAQAVAHEIESHPRRGQGWTVSTHTDENVLASVEIVQDENLLASERGYSGCEYTDAAPREWANVMVYHAHEESCGALLN